MFWIVRLNNQSRQKNNGGVVEIKNFSSGCFHVARGGKI